MSRLSARSLVWLGTAFAVLSLGLPWRFILGTPSYLTMGYKATYCDGSGFCTSTFTPGVFIPGLTGGSYPGADSTARFFIVAAVALALVGGLYRASARSLRWAAYFGVAGILLYVAYGLMGGLLAMAAASVCFWLAARATAARGPGHGDVGVTG